MLNCYRHYLLALTITLLATQTSCGRTALELPEGRDAGGMDGQEQPSLDAARLPDATSRVPDGGSDAGGPPDAATLDGGEDAAGCTSSGSVVLLSTTIREADIVLLIETTGSMGPELAAMGRDLPREIREPLEARLDEVRVSAIVVSDYPPHSHDLDHGVLGWVPIPSTFERVEAAWPFWPEDDGGDAPEAQAIALARVARGPLTWVGERLMPTVCRAGESPGACMAPRGARVVVLISDSPFHEGPAGANPYDPLVERWLGTPMPRFSETIDALVAERIFVVGVSSTTSAEARAHMAAAVSGTGALLDGAPLVFDVPPSGDGIGTAIREAVLGALEGVPRDFDVVARSDEDVMIVPRSVVPPTAGRVEAGRFVGVRPGAQLEVEVRPLEGRGPTSVELDVLDRGRLLVSTTRACASP